MEWMINFLAALVLTTLTGSILMVVWYFVGKRLDAMGHINILYHILRLNTVFFCVPLAYLVLTWLDTSNSIFGGQLFLRTPELLKIAQGVFWIWLVGALLAFGWTVGLCIYLHMCCRRGLPCHQGIRNVFEETCRELGIQPDRVKVIRSYQTESPYLVGVFAPKIVLPVEVYSDEELRIIFIHELTHYQQRDLWMKWASMLILCAQWFNPLVWWHHRIVKRWSEYACDFAAYQQVGSAKTYLTVMSRISVASGRQTHALTAAWYESQPELVTRVERVARYQKQEKGTKSRAFVVCVAMLALSLVAICVTSVEVVRGYLSAYWQTEVLAQDLLSAPEQLEELALDEWEHEGAYWGLTSNDVRSRMNSVEWALHSRALRRTSFISDIVGKEIEVHISIMPENVPVRVGLIIPDGTKVCVESTGSITHTFQLKNWPWYQFFVENIGGQDINVIGSYVIR